MSFALDEKYLELRRLVEQLVGQRLPGERELAEQLRVSRPRVRVLLTALEAEGLVQRRQGSGTYAVDRRVQSLRTVMLLIDEQLKLGDDPFFSLLVERLQGKLQAEQISCVIERINGHERPQSLKDGAITLGLAGGAVLTDLPSDAPPVVGLFLNTDVRVNRRASIFRLADRDGGGEAARRLIGRGCQVLIFVGRRDIVASSERLAGVEMVAQQAGVIVQFVNCPLNYAAGLNLGRTLDLPVEAGVVGMIATNDWLAIGLLAGLSSRASVRELALPIVSFDGLPVTADVTLGIESLAVPLDSIVNDTLEELRHLSQKGAVGRILQYQMNFSASIFEKKIP